MSKIDELTKKQEAQLKTICNNIIAKRYIGSNAWREQMDALYDIYVSYEPGTHRAFKLFVSEQLRISFSKLEHMLIAAQTYKKYSKIKDLLKCKNGYSTLQRYNTLHELTDAYINAGDTYKKQCIAEFEAQGTPDAATECKQKTEQYTADLQSMRGYYQQVVNNVTIVRSELEKVLYRVRGVIGKEAIKDAADELRDITKDKQKHYQKSIEKRSKLNS